MVILKTLFICLYIGISTVSQAEKVHTNSFQTIFEFVKTQSTKSSVLFLTDIDETLIVADQHYGSSAWWEEMITERLSKGHEYPAIRREVSLLWNMAQYQTSVGAMEESVPEIVNHLQRLPNVTTLALTARSYALGEITREQLSSTEIFFTHPFGGEASYAFQVADRTALYKNGMIFCSGAHKGKVLMRMLKKLKVKPDYVVFVDDKEINVDRVRQVCMEAKIPVTVFNYQRSLD